MWRHRAQQRSTPVKREAVITGLASEGLALILGSAEAGSSAVVGHMPTDPVEFRKCARDLKALSAAKEHTNEERGGGRDPGVRRPGAGRGKLPARSKIFRAAMHKSRPSHRSLRPMHFFLSFVYVQFFIVYTYCLMRPIINKSYSKRH